MSDLSQTNIKDAIVWRSAPIELSKHPSDRIVVEVDHGELVLRDVNGAPLVRLAPPSSTGIVVWQIETYLGIARAPGFEHRR